MALEDASQVDKKMRGKTRVEEIMRRKLAVAFPGETGLDVFKKMTENETGRVIVVDPANKCKLLGIVTKSDLMDTLANYPVSK